MTTVQILYLLGAGLSAAVGQIGITLAYGFAPAKDISIFTYASIISQHYSALSYSEKHLICLRL